MDADNAMDLNFHDAKQESLWESYKDWARRNQSKLWFVDDAISRPLFFSTSRWRDIGWGLLELHRLILHQATNCDDDNQRLFGTTVEVSGPEHNTHQDTSASTTTTTSIRFALTMIQTLYPIVQEILRSPGDSQKALQRQDAVRRYLERTRFVLRAMLLIRYWNALQHQQKRSIPPGLLVRGGMVEDHARRIVTMNEEMMRIERQNYIGKRSGKRWSTEPVVPIDTTARIKCAELLYILRPLIYTELGGSHTVWAMSMAMDLVSLWGLKHSRTAGNTESSKEWDRRRMRLLLYALRAPVWNRYAEPAAERVGSTLKAVPLLGGLLHNYFWDWLSYWKDYRLEEG